MSYQHILASFVQSSIYLGAGILTLLLAVYALRNVVWALRYPFLFFNWLMWVLANPLRDAWTDPSKQKASLSYFLLVISGIGPAYWLLMHLALTPLRFINAIYFDIVLYWSVVFCDSFTELIHPRLKYRVNSRNCHYLCRWFLFFPLRFFRIFQRNGLAILEGIIMTGVDVVFPTYTMYHGTSFKGIATNIAQQGRWYVGSGDYAGSGIYFGMQRKTAEHYAKGEDHALICARVTLFPCRNSATLPFKLRRKIGSDGPGISKKLPYPYCSIEHWRNHSYAQWFEYCLVQPDKSGQYVRTWRARPVCVLKHSFPKRIWGGLSLWTGGAGGISVILFSWGTIFMSVYLWKYYLITIP